MGGLPLPDFAVSGQHDRSRPRLAKPYGEREGGKGRVFWPRLGSESGYSAARSATTIEIRTAQESAERPAITTADCPSGKRPSISIDGPILVRFWSTR
jgi:hypothetical protein